MNLIVKNFYSFFILFLMVGSSCFMFVWWRRTKRCSLYLKEYISKQLPFHYRLLDDFIEEVVANRYEDMNLSQAFRVLSVPDSIEGNRKLVKRIVNAFAREGVAKTPCISRRDVETHGESEGITDTMPQELKKRIFTSDAYRSGVVVFVVRSGHI